MVPADHDLIPADHFLVLKHFRLVGGVHSLHTDCRLQLGHREDVDHLNGVLIDELSQHDSHDFEGDP